MHISNLLSKHRAEDAGVPKILLVPAFTKGEESDRGLAAAMSAVAQHIRGIRSVIVVAAHNQDTCNSTTPPPLSSYSGEIRTVLGSLQVDAELRAKFFSQNRPENQQQLDQLIEDNPHFDQIFLFLKEIIGKNETKVLPLLLHATQHQQVQFAAAQIRQLSSLDAII